ncbi:MAG: hypothetical protein V4666_01165 [Bacteroidota bacterium]
MRVQIKNFIPFFMILFFFGCKKSEIDNEIITENTTVEFRENNSHYKGKLELIDKTSNKFKLLRKYFNNLKGFKKAEKDINIYPNYILINEKFKILITVNLIYIEYYDSKNEIIKLYKKISVEEYLSFRYLTQDNKWIYDFGNVYGFGEFETGKYEKGGLIQHVVEYDYKVGKWKFWNLNRVLIAEGEFVTDSSLVMSQGDCDYYKKTSKIRKENWKFYNSKRQIIEPKIEVLFNLENANK